MKPEAMSRHEALVTQHYEEVYRLAYRLVGEKESAEDLTQTVFLRALKGLDGFRGESSLRTWLFAITLNESRRRKFKVQPVDAQDEVPDPAPGTEARAVANLEAEKLRLLIGKLPDDYREVVVLHYLQGLDLEDISGITGTGKGTLKTWLFRARELLREMWGKDHG